jgi:hypothetical protein
LTVDPTWQTVTISKVTPKRGRHLRDRDVTASLSAGDFELWPFKVCRVGIMNVSVTDEMVPEQSVDEP